MKYVATDGTDAVTFDSQAKADAYAGGAERFGNRTWRVGRRPETIQEALAILEAECPDPYAKHYAKAMSLAYAEYGDDGIRYQIVHVLANVQSWRGETARQTKQYLTDLAETGE